MFADQFAHMLKHATAQSEPRPFLYGHIASYDPSQHRVRCIIPSMTDQDGNPTLSPWMPMGTPYASNGAGIQIIYEGGATADNPTGGEQVLIAMFDRNRGVSAVPCMFFHATHKPPATKLPQKSDGYGASADPIAPGDLILSAPPQTAGGVNSVIRMRKAGTIEVWCAGQLTADVVGNINVTTETGDANLTVTKGNANTTVAMGNATVTVATGNATLQAAGVVNIVGAAIRLSKAVGNTLVQLCTSALQNIYNIHTHPDAQGGTTGVPIQQAGQGSLTSIVTAE